MLEELNLCPFCGSKAEVVECRAYSRNGRIYQIKCEGCQVDIGEFDTEAALAAEWNKRKIS